MRAERTHTIRNEMKIWQQKPHDRNEKQENCLWQTASIEKPYNTIHPMDWMLDVFARIR